MMKLSKLVFQNIVIEKVSCMVEPKSLKVWKWPLDQKFWKKLPRFSASKNTTNFILTTFLYDEFVFGLLLIMVKLNFSDAPRAQDNLSKLLTALSAMRRF